jgi:hypothetical protein
MDNLEKEKMYSTVATAEKVLLNYFKEINLEPHLCVGIMSCLLANFASNLQWEQEEVEELLDQTKLMFLACKKFHQEQEVDAN